MCDWTVRRRETEREREWAEMFGFTEILTVLMQGNMNML